MTSNNKDNEENIYEDLPDFHLDTTLAKLESSNSNLQRRVTELENVIVVLNDKINDLQLEKSALKLENDTLSTNISSLYKTAVAEVSRKDNIINDLRRENLAFIRKQKSVPQRNGAQAYTSSNKDLHSNNNSSADKHDSQPSSSSRNRYQNSNRHQTNIENRLRTDKLHKSINCSPDRSNKSIDLRNKLNEKYASKHQSSRLSKVSSPHDVPAALDKSKSNEKAISVDKQKAKGEPKTPALSKNLDEKTANVTPKVPVRKFDTTFNKNLIVVDKSVPNTIYTKRLRKRILDELTKENEADKKSLASESQPSTIVDSTELEIRSVDHASIVNGKQVNSPQSNLFSSSTTETLSNTSVKGEVLSPEKVKSHSLPLVNVPKIAEPNRDIAETCGHENNSKMAVLSLENSVNTKGECNNQTIVSNSEIFPSPISLPTITKDSTVVGSKSVSSIVTVPSSSSLSLNNMKKDISTSSTVSSSVAVSISNNKTPSVSPTNLIALSSQNSSSNSSSLSTPSPLSYNIADCFKKFKKDGKTRINPIYIGPRILTQKNKSERRNANSVRPVLSQYSNLANQKNPKSPRASGGNQIKNKTNETPTNNKIFSLFGKTPEKVEPFVSSNSVGASSDSSLTNFSFLSSSESPVFEKRNHPETACKSVTVSGDKVNAKAPVKQNEEITPIENKVSENILSRDEQMASLFGDVSSDSSSEDEAAPQKTDENKCQEPRRVSQSPTSNVSLPMQPKAEIIQNYLPKTTAKTGSSPADLDNSAKTTPNISNSSLERKSIDFSRIPNLNTPFKSSDSSSLVMFTPAKEILSPIPATPLGIPGRRGSVTQDRSTNSITEKAEVTLEKSGENDVSLSVPELCSFPIEPKVQITQNSLPKSTSTPDSSLSDPKTAENSANSSGGARSFDLSKIPAMHTPFKNTNSNLLMCTPSQAILSPIPPTPQGILGKANPISEKSESSDLFKIIKGSNSADPPIIIKGVAGSKFEEQALLSEVKIEIDSSKKDLKSFSSEDGNSNLSVNSAVVDKKIFLSPNSISTPTLFCTPFKTFSSDSLQSFMRTPARELLSPIPQTPLGSWDIDNDRTSSCDIILESNPSKNSLSPKDLPCSKDNLTCKPGNDSKNQFLCVPSPALQNKETKRNECTREVNEVHLKSDNVPSSQSSHVAPPTLVKEDIKPKEFSPISDDVTHSKHDTVPNRQLSNKFSSPLIKKKSKPKEMTLHSNITSKSNSIQNSQLLSKQEIKSSSPTDKHVIPNEKSNLKTDCISKPRSISNEKNSGEHKSELNSLPAKELLSHSVNKSEISINTSQKTRNLENSKLDASHVISSSVFSEFSPQSNISGNSTSVCSVSYSTVSEQIQFPKSSAKVRKKVVLPSPAANNTVRSTCDNSNISLNPVDITKSDFSSSTQACGMVSIPVASQNNLRREIFNRKRAREPSTDRLMKSRSKIASGTTSYRRAVLIPTDVSNNIIKNSHKYAKSRRKNESPDDEVKDRKRSRSSDKYERSPKKVRGAVKEDETRSRVKTSSTVSMKHPADPEERICCDGYKKSRSSHRKSIDRSSTNVNRNHYAVPSRRLYDRRSRSVSRCRISQSRRSVSRNLGSNYLARTGNNRPNARPKNEPRPNRNSSSIESTPSTSSSHSESKKENRDITHPPKPKMTVSEPIPKQRIAENSEHRERTTSVNSSLSSVSTVNDLTIRTEPIALMDWKLIPIDLAVMKNRYESIFFSAANKDSFHPADPRFKAYWRRSDSSSIESERIGPQASSTPKMIKRRSKNIKLGDSAQIFSPIKTIGPTSRDKVAAKPS